MSLESTTNRMVNLAQSMIYYNKIKSVEDTVRKIRKVTAGEIREYANELFESTDKYVYKNLSRVILSSRNLLLHKAA